MNEQPSCACDLFVHPAEIRNLPGLTSLAYRVGDFASFRRALLLARKNEQALADWRPGGGGDLAVQLVEWWAVLADILTFYNERAIQQAFLRTADLPESVTNLVRLLGYRPRPAIGAVGTVAALISGKKPVTIPKGFQIQSKPGPGKEPQVFEVDADTIAGLPDGVDVDPPPDPKLFRPDGGKSSLLLAGSVTSIKAGDRFLLRRRNWTGTAAQRLLVTVGETRKEKSPRGVTNTRVVLAQDHGLASELAKDWLLLRATQSAALFTTANQPIRNIERDFGVLDRGGGDIGVFARQAPASRAISVETETAASSSSFSIDEIGGELGLLTGTVEGGFFSIAPGIAGGVALAPPFAVPQVLITGHQVHLEAVRTPIDPGDALLLEHSGAAPTIAFVEAHSRDVWYQNAAGATPHVPPSGEDVVPIAVLHSVIRISTIATVGALNAARDEVKVSYAWVEAGTIIGTPSTLFAANSATATLLAAEADAAKLTGQASVLLRDANGIGTSGRITNASAAQVSLESIVALEQSLEAPLELLTNLVGVSRGKSVSNEVLGSGDATLDGQEFTLKKSPLTYLQSGDGYVSTLRVFVNGVEWTEEDSFYGQAADARVFVTKEDAEAKTHVMFGDGINGARLPAGANNVVATYRYGSGAELPEAGTLTVILKPQPGVRGIRNPVAPFGGADPDATEKVRALAPRSVLTFGRAVSADDYEVIAASASGVARARASWTFDAAQQRALVTVYVGDDEGAANAARAAIAGSHDPNQRVNVVRADPVNCSLTLTLVVSGDRVPETVVAAVRAALEDPDTGLFGKNAVRIEQVIFNSQIHRACLSVPGAVAVHSLQFRRGTALEAAARHDPGPGRFFRLTALTITPEQG